MSSTEDKERIRQELEGIGKQIRSIDKCTKVDRAVEIGGVASGGLEFLAALPRITWPEGFIVASTIAVVVVSFWRFRRNRLEEKDLKEVHKGLSRRLHAIPRVVSSNFLKQPPS